TLDLSGYQIYSDVIVSALRNYQIGISFGRLDELKVHWTDGSLVLRDDRLNGAATFMHIAVETTNESNIGIGVHEDFHIHQRAQLWIHEHQNTFDDDYRSRSDLKSFGPS